MNILIFIAALPVVLICMYVYAKDVEKEPKNLLGQLMLYGVISIIPVIIVELILDYFFNTSGNETYLILFLYCFIGIGLIEEIAKWIVSYKVVYKDPEFNEAYDSIVYAVFASLGFALIENILYVFSNGVITGLLRAFTSVPAHTCTGVMMGYFIGLSKTEEIKGNQKQSNKYMLFSVLMPALLHTLYDTFALSKMTNSFYLFLICTVCLYVISIVLIKKVSKNNTKFEGSNVTNEENFIYARNIIIIITVATALAGLVLKVVQFLWR